MNLPSLLTNVLWAMPLILVWVGIAAYAFFNYDQHPRRSGLTIAAMGLFIVGRLTSTGGLFLAGLWTDEVGMSQYSLVYSVVSMATTALVTVGWVLVGLALFAAPEEGIVK